MSLEELWTKIEAKFDSLKNDLDKRINGLENSLAKFEADCGAKIDHLADSVSGIRRDVDQSNASIGRLEKVRELIISGVPYKQNENLAAAFGVISTRLGYNEANIPLASLARLAKSIAIYCCRFNSPYTLRVCPSSRSKHLLCQLS